MKKGLSERFARFHARFPLDDIYLGLPSVLRNDAYLFLLALNGHQRAGEGDAMVPLAVVEQLGRMMGVNASRMIQALGQFEDNSGKKRVVEREGEFVRLVKYSKWQDTPEEIAELKAKRSEAGIRGAAARWGTQTQIKDARGVITSAIANEMALAMASAKAGAMASAYGKNGKGIAEREGERESLNTPPSPPTVSASAVVNDPDDPILQFQLGWQEFNGGLISEADKFNAGPLLAECPRLGVGGMLTRIRETAEYRLGTGDEPIRTLMGYRTWLVTQEAHLAQRGVLRPRGRSGGGMTRLADSLPKPKAASS